MRRIIPLFYCCAAALIGALLIPASPAKAAATRTVSLRWNASTTPSVTGYKVYWGSGTRNYQNVRDVRNVLSTSLTLYTNTQYYVTVCAYTNESTSRFSNEVIVAPSATTP